MDINNLSVYELEQLQKDIANRLIDLGASPLNDFEINSVKEMVAQNYNGSKGYKQNNCLAAVRSFRNRTKCDLKHACEVVRNFQKHWEQQGQ